MPSGSRGRSVDGHGGCGLGAHPPRLSLCSHALYLGRRWYEDENYSHGFLVPLVSAYLVWERRGPLRSLTARSSLGGLLIVIGGLGAFLLSLLAAELLVQRLSLVVVLTGLVGARP
jgi:Transmembrane exosortase (Exosortase_EpsH)